MSIFAGCEEIWAAQDYSVMYGLEDTPEGWVGIVQCEGSTALFSRLRPIAHLIEQLVFDVDEGFTIRLSLPSDFISMQDLRQMLETFYASIKEKKDELE